MASAFDGSEQLPLWRSLLFVPLNVPRYLERASSTGADALVLDLEDSVAAADKEAARHRASQVASRYVSAGMDVIVRINRPLRQAVRDIESVVCPAVRALMLPKIESVSHVRLLAEVTETVEREKGIRPGSTGFYVVVEDVRVLPDMPAIAEAHPRVVAFTCGTEDLAASMHASPDPDVLRLPKQLGVFAARSAGVHPLGVFASSADFKDLEAFREVALLSRRFGVSGATCIHPSQVAVLNEVFSPTSDEVDFAKRLVAAAETAAAQGRGAFSFEGRMVDAPIVKRALQVLSLIARIEARA